MRDTTLGYGFVLLLAGCTSASEPSDGGEAGGLAAAAGSLNDGGSRSNGGAAEAGAGRDSGSGGTFTGGSSTGGSSTGGTSTGGSSSNTGGSTGSGGSATHLVEPCPTANGSPGQVGAWEDITPDAIKTSGVYTPSGAILVDPQDRRIVYGGSEGRGLFKSTDCGASFVHVSTGTNGSQISSGRMWDMVIDPVHSNVLYTVEGYGAGGLWKTTNGGVDWSNMTPTGSDVANAANGNFTSIIGMDVTNPDHLVLAFHSGCSGAYSPNCQAETNDGGRTWRLFKAPIAGEGVGVVVLGPKTFVSSGYQDVEETVDGGNSWKKVSGATAHWQLYQSPTSGAFYMGTMNGILKSNDGIAWSTMPGVTDAVQGITGDGTTLYAGEQWGTKVFAIPESNPTSYKALPSKYGLYFMAYDVDHHLLYASDMQGLWRMRTE